jgi:ribosomal-protein-alanine N-acetyltransferase
MATAIQAEPPPDCLQEASMTFHLRPARVTDLPAIYRGEQYYIQRWEPKHEVAWRRNLERHLTRWVDNFERITVAVVDEHVVGYALWIPALNVAELGTLNVSEAFRRQGIGQALLSAYMRGAEQQGFTQFALSVRPDNPARHLYERYGFVHRGMDEHGYHCYERIK